MVYFKALGKFFSKMPQSFKLKIISKEKYLEPKHIMKLSTAKLTVMLMSG